MNGIQSTHISSDWCASRGIRDGVGLDAISSVAFVLVAAVLMLSLPGTSEDRRGAAITDDSSACREAVIWTLLLASPEYVGWY